MDSLITTERLILRRPTKTDLHVLFEIHSDPQTNKFNPYGPQKSIDETEKMLADWLDHWQKYDFGYWVITTVKEPKTIIGCGGLKYKNMAHGRRANLYFRFRPSSWGNGYATEMAKSALRLGFGELGLNQIIALVRPNNAPSVRLLDKLGMIRRGILKDTQGKSYYYILDRNSE